MAPLSRKFRISLDGITEKEGRILLKGQLEALRSKELEKLGISTPEEYLHKFVARVNDQARVQKLLDDPNIPAEHKMLIRCEAVKKWGKLLFSCHGCWLLPGNCVCDKMRQVSFEYTKVIIHMHHSEWGKGSNTGTVLRQSIKDSEILMRNCEPDDERLQAILEDKESTPVVLWPGDDALLPAEVKSLAAARSGGRLTVIALDATWANARRLHGSYPPGTIYVRLPPESALGAQTKSLLNPVRKYSGAVDENGRVSTLEATAALLLELTGDVAAHQHLLDNLRYKVDVLRIQKSVEPVYGMLEHY